jgi:hypothetical protein
VLVRVAPAALGLFAVALSSAGADGTALVVLLVAVPVGAAAGLYVVLEVGDHQRSHASAIPAALSLLLLVAAAATRRPELALGCLACLTLDQLLAPRRVRRVSELHFPRGTREAASR